jgi:hypothetical protein
VISAVPTPTPITTPEALTVATAVLEEDQVPPAVPLEEIVVVLPWQIEVVPLSVPASAPEVTVILNVEELFVEQGEVAFTVYVIVAEPAETAVTKPEELTVATEVLDEDHVPPVFPFVMSVVVPGKQIVEDPLIVPALGGATTVTSIGEEEDPVQGEVAFTE